MQTLGLNRMAHRMTADEKTRTAELLKRMQEASKRSFKQNVATGITEDDLNHFPPEFHDYFEIERVA